MEVVTIEKKCFEELLLLVGALTHRVDELSNRCRDRTMNEWLDGQDVCFALNISQRTLQTLRDKGVIGYTQINRKFFYKPEEINRLLPIVEQYRKE